MRKLLFIIVVLLCMASPSFSDAGDLTLEDGLDGEFTFNEDGKVKTKADKLYFFPDIGIGAAYNLKYHRTYAILNIEVLDTDDFPNIIPLKIKKMPMFFDIVADFGVGNDVIFASIGLKLLPILEPTVLGFYGLDFSEDGREEAYGIGIRFGAKF